MSTPTIKDVAKLAGVSISTVSRVMNDSKPVGPESRRRVLDAIKKLDFKRNELARSLVMKRSNLIGVIVKDLGIPYMAQLLRGAEEIGRMYKYDILLSSSYGNSEQEQVIVDFFFRKQAEAILLITEDVSPEVVVKLKENDNPYIQIDKYYDGDFNTVSLDYSAATESMTNYLLELGHENILFVKELNNTKVGAAKYDGYAKAVKNKGFRPHLETVENHTIDEGYKFGQVMVELMKEKNITAVFCSEDNIAIGLINYCYDNKIKIPEDISIVGFGDESLASIYRPTLTTVKEPYYDIGAVAMRRLIKALKKEEKIDVTSYLPTELVIRQSTGKPRNK